MERAVRCGTRPLLLLQRRSGSAFASVNLKNITQWLPPAPQQQPSPIIPPKDDRNVPVCLNFLNGKCAAERACKYRHVLDEPSMKRSMTDLKGSPRPLKMMKRESYRSKGEVCCSSSTSEFFLLLYYIWPKAIKPNDRSQFDTIFFVDNMFLPSFQPY